jgi:predicted nucleotidyltransferase
MNVRFKAPKLDRGQLSMAKCAIDKEAVKAKLLAHEPELKAAGILHLHLHGSVVRGEAGPNSDVDLAAVFDRAKVRSALNEINLKNRIATLLGVEVDLANRDRLKDNVRSNFDREAELVF